MRKAKQGRAGTAKEAKEKKQFLHVELDEGLRTDLKIAALSEGMCLKDWLPVFLRKHLDRPGVAARS